MAFGWYEVGWLSPAKLSESLQWPSWNLPISTTLILRCTKFRPQESLIFSFPEWDPSITSILQDKNQSLISLPLHYWNYLLIDIQHIPFGGNYSLAQYFGYLGSQYHIHFSHSWRLIWLFLDLCEASINKAEYIYIEYIAIFVTLFVFYNCLTTPPYRWSLKWQSMVLFFQHINYLSTLLYFHNI